MRGFLLDDLIASAKRRGRISDSAYTVGEWLAIANEEMSTFLVPLIVGVQEDYYTTDADFDLAAAGPYRVPARAVANGLREVSFLDSAGETIDVPQVSVDELADVSWGVLLKSQSVTYVNRAARVGPVTMRMTYAFTPSLMIQAASAAQVSAINGTAITLQAIPTPANPLLPDPATLAPTVFNGQTSFDAYKASPGFECIGFDITGTCDGTTLTATPPTGLAVGDYVSIANQTPVPQAPRELHPVLAQSIAAAALDSLGKVDEAKSALAMRDAMARAVLPLMRNRVKGAPRTINTARSIFRYTARW